MSNIFQNIISRSELSQSEFLGDFYKEHFVNENPAFSKNFVDEVGELFNKLILKYDGLTSFQKEMLASLFHEFNVIRITIDPKRLKSFKYTINDDDELLLFRESSKGLINIIINPEDCIAFSFIPNEGDERKFYFVYPDGDFEKLALEFFSY